MPLFRYVSSFVLFTIFTVVANAQADKTFPTNDEINLMLTQSERAIQQYKPLIDREATEMGKSGAMAATKDREAMRNFEVGLKAFRVKPQAFNSPAGFIFLEFLDDQSRNATLCGGGALSQVTLQMMDGNITKADSLTHLSQSCTDVSASIYTARENAKSLYLRYVEAEQQLAGQGVEAAGKCMAILKKKSVPSKP
ncbi:MAG TPA: hypothetical protein VIJ79_14125 [Acidobacteriaceae bacterium]